MVDKLKIRNFGKNAGDIHPGPLRNESEQLERLHPAHAALIKAQRLAMDQLTRVGYALEDVMGIKVKDIIPGREIPDIITKGRDDDKNGPGFSKGSKQRDF